MAKKDDRKKAAKPVSEETLKKLAKLVADLIDTGRKPEIVPHTEGCLDKDWMDRWYKRCEALYDHLPNSKLRKDLLKPPEEETAESLKPMLLALEAIQDDLDLRITLS